MKGMRTGAGGVMSFAEELSVAAGGIAVSIVGVGLTGGIVID